MTDMEILLCVMAIMAISGAGFIALGVEDHRHWKDFQAENLPVKVEIPVMFPNRSRLIASGEQKEPTS